MLTSTPTRCRNCGASSVPVFSILGPCDHRLKNWNRVRSHIEDAHDGARPPFQY